MTSLICPVCGEELRKTEKQLSCARGHSFDIARSGYVNLLLNAGKGRHGDDKLMVRARTRLLDKGYYDPLSRRVAALAAKYAPPGALIVDSGCGEGKYSVEVMESVADCRLVGIDISREALICAAKRSRDMTLAVASSAALPIQSGAADAVLNIFSPLSAGEFHRVLKRGGVLIRVYPLENHLFELKKLIYDVPIVNPPEKMGLEGFRLLEVQEVKYRISLTCNEDIMALFMMTPYYYKTGRADQQKAEQAQALDTALEFGIAVYEKE